MRDGLLEKIFVPHLDTEFLGKRFRVKHDSCRKNVHRNGGLKYSKISQMALRYFRNFLPYKKLFLFFFRRFCLLKIYLKSHVERKYRKPNENSESRDGLLW
jgi:hypothetical protein